MRYYNSILELMNNTPLIRLNNIEKAYNLTYKLFAKVERFMPTGSIKDRPTFYMIKKAFENKLINKDTLIISASSGNLGISLASVCAYYSLKLHIYMPSSFSIERRVLMEKLGAKVILTDAKKGMKYADTLARIEANKVKNSYFVSQFDNEHNVLSHYKTTAEEIIDALDRKIDVLIACVGSGGTISGIAKRLKKEAINTEIIAVEPYSSPLLSQNKTGKHKIEGIGANFVPKILSKELLDRIILVKDEDALFYQDELASKEGILVGVSSGAALAASLSLDKIEYKDKNVIIILPDNMERYLSKYV